MTVPHVPGGPQGYHDYEAELGSQSPIAAKEWQQFMDDRKNLMQEILDSAHQVSQPLHPPTALDQVQPGQIGQPSQPATAPSPELVGQAHFWDIEDPESMDSATLQRMIDQRRAEMPRDETRSPGSVSLGLVAGATAAAGTTSKVVENLLGNMQDLPFAGQYLHQILGQTRAKYWLDQLRMRAAYVGEGAQAAQPARDLEAFQFVTGAGKLAGYMLPMYGAWEGLGALGAAGSGSSIGWLGTTGRALSLASVRGALTSAMFMDPNASDTDKAIQIGLGGVLGQATQWGKWGMAGLLGLAGAQVGSQVGNTPGERARHALEGGVAAASLPFLAPYFAQALGKVRESFPTPADAPKDYRGDFQPHVTPPGEADADWEFVDDQPQISGNPPTPPALPPGAMERLQAGPQGGPMALPAAPFSSEPPMLPGPDGVPKQIGGPDETGMGGVPAQLPPTPQTPLLGGAEIPKLLTSGKEYDSGRIQMYDQSVEHLQRLFTDPGYMYDMGYEWTAYGPYNPNTQEYASSALSRIQGEADAARYIEREYINRGRQDLKGVTSGALAGSKVADNVGRPLRVYHGTAWDFGDFDVSKADPEALYGPGLYHTESLKTAEGYAGNSGIMYQWSNGGHAEALNRLRQIMPPDVETPESRWAYQTLHNETGAAFPDQTVLQALEQRVPGLKLMDLVRRPAPNVRPALLDIKNPFNIDKKWSPEEVGDLVSKLETVYPQYDWRQQVSGDPGVMLGVGPIGEPNAFSPRSGMTGEELYESLSHAAVRNSTPADESALSGLNVTYKPENYADKVLLNDALSKAGFDGITHIGGAITGNAPHRVWIAFKPEQVHPWWRQVSLDDTNAQNAGEALTKQATVMESATLPDAVGKPQVGDADLAAAAKSTNPGGVTVIRNVGSPLEAFKEHPDLNFVQRDGKIDMLVGQVSPAQIDQYSKYGMFEGQRVVTANGVEGVLRNPAGKRGLATIMREGGGPPITLSRDNIFPSRFGTPQVEAPDLWDSFKADLMRYANEQAEQAGMSPVRSLWDARIPGMVEGHLMDYLDRRGIEDPGVRQAIHSMVSDRWVQEARDLDPESRDLQDRMEMLEASATNDREQSDRPIPVSLDEKAESKGFLWLSNPGADGGVLRDNLNPEAAHEVHFDNDQAAETFLQAVDRAAPELTPASSVPADVAKAGPAGERWEPRMGVEETADHLVDANARIEEELSQLGAGAEGGAGGGAIVPPGAPPAGGSDEYQPRLTEGERETLGDQFARLRRDDPQKYMHLQRKFSGNVLRYTRYLMQKLETSLVSSGLDLGRAWEHYEALETAHTKAENEAWPWEKEYGEIMREFPRRLLRDGTVTRIHEIEDPNARMAAWWRLQDQGHTTADVRRFIAADDRLTDFNHRWFEFLTGDPNFGLTAEREINRYMSHVRARQAQHDQGLDLYDGSGYLSPEVQYFAEFARDGNVQFRITDARELGRLMIRGGMFKKHVAEPWQNLVSTWQDNRIPEPIRNLLLDHAKAVRYGFDPSGDAAARGLQTMMTDFLRTPVTIREASNLLNVPLRGTYMALLGGRTSIFFREATQPLLALAKVRTPFMAGVYRDLLNGDKLSEMFQRGVDGGWINQEERGLEAASIFEEPANLRENELIGVTPAQAARREMLARINDSRYGLPAWLSRPSESNLNTLKYYGKLIQKLRMVTGESAFRQADAMLQEYRRSQIEAALTRDPSKAIPYNVFAERSFFSSFGQPQQAKLKELVDSGDDKAAAEMFAREVTKWAIHVFKRTEQPSAIRGGWGRFLFTFGNFTGQTLEAVNDMLSNGTPRQRARAMSVYGAFNLGLRRLTQITGWGFAGWGLSELFRYSGGPMLEHTVNAVKGYQAATGMVGAAERGEQPTREDQTTLSNTLFNTGGAAFQQFFPYEGYLRTASELGRAAESANPVERSARFLVTGDRGDRIDWQRWDDRMAAEFYQRVRDYEAQQHVPPPAPPGPMANHPGAGAQQ